METLEIANNALPFTIRAAVLDANKSLIDAPTVVWSLNQGGIITLEVAPDTLSCTVTPLRGMKGIVMVTASVTQVSGRIIEQYIGFNISDPQPVEIRLAVEGVTPPIEFPKADDSQA